MVKRDLPKKRNSKVLKEKRRSEVPAEDGFWTIKRSKTKESQVVVKDSLTPGEREEMVLRNNRFWIPNNTDVEKAKSSLSFGVGKSLPQLDGNDSLSESDDEVPNKKRRVEREGSRKKGAKRKVGGKGKVQGKDATKKVCVSWEREVDKIFDRSSGLAPNTDMGNGEANQNIENENVESAPNSPQNTKMGNGAPNSPQTPPNREQNRTEQTATEQNTLQQNETDNSEQMKRQQTKTCPLENCSYHTVKVKNMRQHLQRHKTTKHMRKLSKNKIEDIITQMLNVKLSPVATKKDIDDLQLAETDEDIFSEKSDSEVDEEPALNPHPTYEQKISKFDEEIQQAENKITKLAELRQQGNEFNRSQLQSLAISNPPDLAERMMEEIKKANERDEDWRKEIEELNSKIHRSNQRRKLCVVLQNQQKARETTKQTSRQDNTDMGNGGTAPHTDTDTDIDLDTDTETNPHTDPTPHTHLDTTTTPPHTSQNNSDTDMGNGGTAPNTETENGWTAPNSPQNTDIGNGGTQQNRTDHRTQNRPDTVKRSRNEKVNIAVCPICLKELCRKSVLKTHLQTKHKELTRTEVDEIMKNIKHTTEKCLHCKTEHGNLNQHLKTCKRKKASEEKKERAKLENQKKKQGLEDEDLTEKKSMEEILADFQNDMTGALSTKANYTNWVKIILKFWEEDPRFESWKLLSPLEHNLTYPDILDLLQKTTSTSSQRQLCNAYVAFCKFILSKFSRKYNNSDKFKNIDKNVFRQQVLFQKAEVSAKISTLNDINQRKTQLNKANTRKDDSVLIHKPNRCCELYMHLKNSNSLKTHLTRLTKESREDIEADGWDECRFRKLLLALLTVFGGGQRPHVASHMTIEEFLEATTTDGIQRVLVKDNKTQKRYGPASMLFTLPGLYAACMRYYTLYRTETPTSNFLLCTTSGRAMKLSICMDFLADNYLKDILDKSEKKHFIPKVWRRYWSNINISHKDEDVTKMGRVMMAHSKSTDLTWYKESEERSTKDTQWATQMLERMQEISSNPNTVLENQSGEDLDETDDDQSDSETQDQNTDTGNGVTSTSPPPPNTEQNRTNPDLSDRDRHIFREMLHPSKEKHGLPNQIKNQFNKSQEFKAAYLRLLAKKKQKTSDKKQQKRLALNTIRKCIEQKTKEQIKTSNASRAKKRQESKNSKKKDD